jgi:hypothetical protein
VLKFVQWVSFVDFDEPALPARASCDGAPPWRSWCQRRGRVCRVFGGDVYGGGQCSTFCFQFVYCFPLTETPKFLEIHKVSMVFSELHVI